MLDKIDFTDIYKFIASIGLALVIAAFIIPVFVFQLDLTKNYRDIELTKLSSLIKESMDNQEKVINDIIKIWWFFSLISFLGGILLMVIGILNWKKRQNVIDRLQDIALLEKENNIKTAPASEIDNKVNEDADEIEETNQNRASFIQDYKSLEKRIFEALSIKDQNIKLTRNAKVGNYVYDLIIIQHISEGKRIHFVCEIKYYQKGIFYSYIQQGVSSFLLAISNYWNNFNDDRKRVQIEPVMIWICRNTDQKTQLLSYKDKVRKYAENRGIHLNIIIRLDTEINILINDLMI